ncbi:MAG: hypothetical protein MHMPM18_004667 [Marteilia pararefringens]
MKTSQQVEDEKMLDSSTIPDLNPFVEEASIFSPTGHLFRLAMFSSPKYREFVEIVMDDIDQIDQEYIRSQLQCDDLKISKTSRQTALLHFPSPESAQSYLLDGRHRWDFNLQSLVHSNPKTQLCVMKLVEGNWADIDDACELNTSVNNSSPDLTVAKRILQLV